MKTYNRFKDKGVVFVGLTAEGADDLEKSQAYISELGIPWPNLYGAVTPMEALEVHWLPTVFVVGKDGRIAWNSQMGGELEDAIGRALESGA